MSEHVEGFVTASGGQQFWQGWLPDGEPVGVVMIAHGYAEHGGRYAHVAERLTDAGYAVYAPDHRAHGRSEGQPRSNFGRLTHVVTDFDSFVRQTATKHDGLAVFLIGHSMGSMVVLYYLTGVACSPYAVRGAVLSGSGVDITVGSPVQRFAAKVLSALAPNLGVIKPLDSDHVSRDPVTRAAYETDPLNYRGKVLARVGGEAFASAAVVSPLLSSLDVPLLVMHGSGDMIASASGARTVVEQVSSRDATLKVYDGLYHEIYNEPEREAVLDDVVAWLDARTRSTSH